MSPVKFPTGRVVHLGEPGAAMALCAQMSTAQPKHSLVAVAAAATCKHCQKMAAA